MKVVPVIREDKQKHTIPTLTKGRAKEGFWCSQKCRGQEILNQVQPKSRDNHHKALYALSLRAPERCVAISLKKDRLLRFTRNDNLYRWMRVQDDKKCIELLGTPPNAYVSVMSLEITNTFFTTSFSLMGAKRLSSNNSLLVNAMLFCEEKDSPDLKTVWRFCFSVS